MRTPERWRSSMRASMASTVSPSRTTTRRLAVLVGASVSVGAIGSPRRPWRSVSMALSMVSRSPARSLQRRAQLGPAGGGHRVGAKPAPSDGLGEGGPEHRVAVLDGHLADAGPAHPGVPPLDVGDSHPGDRHLGQRVGQDGRRPAGVVAPGRGRPGRLVLLHPLGQELGHRGTGCTGDGTDGQLGGDPLGVLLRPPDGPADLRGAPALVPPGESPDLPHPRLALADGRHAVTQQ
jgi:hypothetical protein